MNIRNGNNAARLSTFLVLIFCLMVGQVAAQGELEQLKTKAGDLMKESKMTEAVPVLERILELDPRDANAYELLGTALLGLAVNTNDAEEKKRLRLAARQSFVKARDLGNDTNFVKAMIGSLPMDGSEGRSFSDVPRSHALTYAGEQAFTQGKIDEALDLYKQALEADPTNYYAALFSGDMYLKKNDFKNAEIWYQKAIVIDPYIETAYRYSATPLMRQGKYAEARDRYIEAWITEPYSRFALNGIIQWGQVTNTPLGHPRIDVPETEIGPDGKPTTKINVDPLANDGSMAWIAYFSTRETWKKDKFTAAFPKENSLRHTLMEEAEALRAVVKMATAMKPKQLNPQIEMLSKLDNDGLLEAFILLARADEGIVQDHAGYLRSNKEKLRSYVVKYVIGSGK
ncbi:tetratricopeptide repeat protein [Leptolyngbya sp. 15MV]|nr:tetratricopeptide repeat protein [Leptolyngbya sp. 15MV]